MKLARELACTAPAPAVVAGSGFETLKSLYRSASILLPMETQSIASLGEYTWPMTRVIAGFTKGKVNQGQQKGEQSIAMRNASMYRNMLRPLVNAARLRTGMKHIELVTKTVCKGPAGQQLLTGQCALVVHDGRAAWLLGTASGNPETSQKNR